MVGSPREVAALDPSSRSADIVRVEGLSLRRRRWKRHPDSFKSVVINRLRGIGTESEEFWPLRDVSFSIQQGEFVGICGANGAGKSTLLKVIARILPPSKGRVTLRGTLTSLLQLGAGFLHDLPGWENILLNGAILGLTESEIRDRMPAIIAFADLGDFIYSPVSTYSTGMYMRLGFSIASHVDADIILLDEVVAVGDAEFETKCFSWLRQLKSRGTSILLASHSIPILEQMCDRVLWLDRGTIERVGPPDEVLRAYQRNAVRQ